jgi:hypothetical protein
MTQKGDLDSNADLQLWVHKAAVLAGTVEVPEGLESSLAVVEGGRLVEIWVEVNNEARVAIAAAPVSNATAGVVPVVVVVVVMKDLSPSPSWTC